MTQNKQKHDFLVKIKIKKPPTCWTQMLCRVASAREIYSPSCKCGCWIYAPRLLWGSFGALTLPFSDSPSLATFAYFNLNFQKAPVTFQSEHRAITLWTTTGIRLMQFISTEPCNIRWYTESVSLTLFKGLKPCKELIRHALKPAHLTVFHSVVEIQDHQHQILAKIIKGILGWNTD